jgi:hypothetical protein
MARNIADPKPWLEAAALVEAMHPEVCAATLKEDVITALGPSCCKRSAHHGTSMALAPKFRMSDDIFEKPVLPPSAQEIRRGDEHAGCDDLGVHAGYENRNAFVRQRFGPNLLGSLFRLRARAYFRELIEFEQRREVRSLSKPSIWHWDTMLRTVIIGLSGLLFGTLPFGSHGWLAPAFRPVGPGAGRDELAAILEFVRPGDELVVVKLDRLVRSTRDVLNLVRELEHKKAGTACAPFRDTVNISQPFITFARTNGSAMQAPAPPVSFTHEYTTLEHLLLALTDDVDAPAVMSACKVDLDALKEQRTISTTISKEL